MRRARLRRQFGPEYDRLVEKLGSRRKADAELAERQRRVQALSIRELSPEQRASYSGDGLWCRSGSWIPRPKPWAPRTRSSGTSCATAATPSTTRSPVRHALTVYHGRSLEGYRKVQDLRAESATTEQLREAMIHYRALFEDLTGLREAHGEPAGDRVAEIRDRAAGRHAVTDGGTRTAETAEPVTAAPGTEVRVTKDP